MRMCTGPYGSADKHANEIKRKTRRKKQDSIRQMSFIAPVCYRTTDLATFLGIRLTTWKTKACHTHVAHHIIRRCKVSLSDGIKP